MKIRLLSFAILLALSACSDDEQNPTPAPDTGSQRVDMASDLASTDTDGTNDLGETDDLGEATDMATEADTGDQPEDMSNVDAAVDMNSTADASIDASMTDTGTDMMAGDPYAGRPVGQCVVADDCPANPNGKVCNRNLPGGSCGACGNDTVCDDECNFGTCITTCSDNSDCPPGLRCTSTGRCGAESCVNDVCPVPLYGCNDSGLCARIDCSADASVCPAQTTCLQGLCVEDRFLSQ